MYRKSDTRTKLLFSQSQPIAFLLFSLPSPSSLLIIRTLSSEDGDGSENVAEKVNSRSSNLQVHLREITVFMALADINFLLLLSTADDVSGLYWVSLWWLRYVFFQPSTVIITVQSTPMCKRPQTIRRFIVGAYENLTQGSLPRKGPNSCTFWKRIHCGKFQVYQMCRFMFSMKVLRILWLVYIQRM